MLKFDWNELRYARLPWRTKLKLDIDRFKAYYSRHVPAASSSETRTVFLRSRKLPIFG